MEINDGLEKKVAGTFKTFWDFFFTFLTKYTSLRQKGEFLKKKYFFPPFFQRWHSNYKGLYVSSRNSVISK